MNRRIARLKGLCLALTIACAGWSGLVGCGYRFVDQTSYPAHVERIYVTIFFNQTSETGVENILAQEINQEFTRRDIRALAGHIEQSDALLKGTIDKVTIRTASRRGETLTTEARVTITVASQLYSTAGAELWGIRDVSASETYAVSADLERTNEAKREAIQKVSTRLAEKLYNQLTVVF